MHKGETKQCIFGRYDEAVRRGGLTGARHAGMVRHTIPPKIGVK